MIANLLGMMCQIKKLVGVSIERSLRLRYDGGVYFFAVRSKITATRGKTE